jgi:hypothetical protein
MRAGLVALVALGLWGCAAHPTGGPLLLDMYADRGALPIRGARRSAPGPSIYRALQRDAGTVPLLAGRGEPDTVEVVNRRGRARRVVFTYRGARDGVPRRIVIEPSNRVRGKRAQGASAASSRLGRRRGVARSRPVTLAATESDPTPATATLTARQALECPIDPERPDCRSVCGRRRDYEWCR